MINIAIDGFPVLKVKGGIGYYIDSIIGQFANQHNDDVRLYIYLPSNYYLDNKTLSTHNNVIIMRMPLLIKSEIIWSIICVPLLILFTNPDIFLGMSQYVPLLRIKKVKYCLFVHDYAYKIFPESLRIYRRLFLRLLMPRFLKLSDIIVFNSNATMDRLKSVYPNIWFKAKRCILIPPIRDIIVKTVQVNTFSNNPPSAPSSQLALNSITDYVFTLSPLEPRKNVPLLIYSYCSFLDLYGPNSAYDLVLAGSDGWNSQSSQTAIDYIVKRYPAKFHKFGFIGDELYIQLLLSAKACLFLSEYEGYGMTVAESLSCCADTFYTDIPEHIEAAKSRGYPVKLDRIASYLPEIFHKDSSLKFNQSKSLANCIEYEETRCNQFTHFFDTIILLCQNI